SRAYREVVQQPGIFADSSTYSASLTFFLDPPSYPAYWWCGFHH
ncbi:11038_t:CDS:2, partial [Funneliformis mosseae]